MAWFPIALFLVTLGVGFLIGEIVVRGKRIRELEFQIEHERNRRRRPNYGMRDESADSGTLTR